MPETPTQRLCSGLTLTQNSQAPNLTKLLSCICTCQSCMEEHRSFSSCPPQPDVWHNRVILGPTGTTLHGKVSFCSQCKDKGRARHRQFGRLNIERTLKMQSWLLSASEKPCHSLPRAEDWLFLNSERVQGPTWD